MVRDSSDDDSDSIDPSSISITIQGIKNLRFIILILFLYNEGRGF